MQTFFVENTANLLILVTGVSVVAIIWSLVLSFQLTRLHRRYRKAMSMGGEMDMEEALGKQAEQWQQTTETLQTLVKRVDAQDSLLQHTLHRVGVVRFNPFSDAGGDLSFSVALLDAANNGVVVSSLHTREGTRVYAKPIIQGDSSYTLSEEEKQAIAQAQETYP